MLDIPKSLSWDELPKWVRVGFVFLYGLIIKGCDLEECTWLTFARIMILIASTLCITQLRLGWTIDPGSKFGIFIGVVVIPIICLFIAIYSLTLEEASQITHLFIMSGLLLFFTFVDVCCCKINNVLLCILYYVSGWWNMANVVFKILMDTL